ncbi:replication initiator protein A [Streptococcus suis]
MLPKVLVTEDLYKNLSSDAKILYACLLERSSLSFKNDWIDEQGRVYIVFTVEEIMKMLNKSNKTAVKILNELDANTKGIGLIERKRQGLGKPNIIYVKDFMSVFRSECKNYTSEVKNLHSRNVETTLQEVKFLHSSNTNINKKKPKKKTQSPPSHLKKIYYPSLKILSVTTQKITMQT